MAANYNNTSPWYITRITQNYLDILAIRSVPAEPDDVQYTIGSQYQYRPDLLAYDLYGDATLWWVFTQRNLDILEDPVFDFTVGKKIFLPKQSSLTQLLGL
jgi:hypothetical protein